MKKLFFILLILCLALIIRSNAQDLVLNQSSNDKVKDTTSMANMKNGNADDDGIFIVHATDNRSRVIVGLKAGFNGSNVYSGLSGFKVGPEIGWVAGAFMSVPVGKLFGLQFEFLYGEKGFKATDTLSGNNYSFERKTIYLDMPLLLQFKANKSISLLAGPLLSFLIHSKDKFDAGSITNEQEQVMSNSIIHQNILGAEAGIDIYIQKVVFSLRTGLDLQELGDQTAANSRRFENVWVQATIGYMF